MRKIPTIFIRDPSNMSRVIRKVLLGCERATWGRLHATEKIDGTAMLFKDGRWWKRYLLRPNKKRPVEFVPAQDKPTETGKLPRWVPVGNRSEDKWHLEGIEKTIGDEGQTYELVGPKVQSNPYGFLSHCLEVHGARTVPIVDCSFDGLREFLDEYRSDEKLAIEGIVFWDAEKPVCKIKRRDFGLEWPLKPVMSS